MEEKHLKELRKCDSVWLNNKKSTLMKVKKILLKQQNSMLIYSIGEPFIQAFWKNKRKKNGGNDLKGFRKCDSVWLNNKKSTSTLMKTRIVNFNAYLKCQFSAQKRQRVIEIDLASTVK